MTAPESTPTLPFPDRPLHTDACPGCRHPLGRHVDEWGCADGWSWHGSDSPHAGLSITEGCECPLALARQYRPPSEGDV